MIRAMMYLSPFVRFDLLNLSRSNW